MPQTVTQDATYEAELARDLRTCLKAIAQQTGSETVARYANDVTTETHVFDAICDLTLLNKTNQTRVAASQDIIGTLAHAQDMQTNQFNDLMQTPWHQRLFTGFPATRLISADQCGTCNGKGRVICQFCKGQTTQPCPSYQCRSGRMPCGSCSTGKAKCHNCAGQGSISKTESIKWERPNGEFGYTNQFKMVPCTICGGSGQYGNCLGCGGAAEVTCSTCNGRSTITCSKCSGSGETKCGNCDCGVVYHQLTAQPYIRHSTEFDTADSARFKRLKSLAPGFLTHSDARDPRNFQGKSAGNKGHVTYTAHAHASVLMLGDDIAAALGKSSYDPFVSDALKQQAARKIFDSLEKRAFDTLAQTPLGTAFLGVLRGNPSNDNQDLIAYYDTSGQGMAETTTARGELEHSISRGVISMRIGVLLLAMLLPFVIYERGFLTWIQSLGLDDWRPFLIASFVLPMFAVLVCSLVFQNRRRRMVRNTGLGSFKGHTLKLPRLMIFAVVTVFVSHALVLSGAANKITRMPVVSVLNTGLDYPVTCGGLDVLESAGCSMEMITDISMFAVAGPLSVDELIAR